MRLTVYLAVFAVVACALSGVRAGFTLPTVLDPIGALCGVLQDWLSYILTGALAINNDILEPHLRKAFEKKGSVAVYDSLSSALEGLKNLVSDVDVTTIQKSFFTIQKGMNSYVASLSTQISEEQKATINTLIRKIGEQLKDVNVEKNKAEIVRNLYFLYSLGSEALETESMTLKNLTVRECMTYCFMRASRSMLNVILMCINIVETMGPVFSVVYIGLLIYATYHSVRLGLGLLDKIFYIITLPLRIIAWSLCYIKNAIFGREKPELDLEYDPEIKIEARKTVQNVSSSIRNQRDRIARRMLGDEFVNRLNEELNEDEEDNENEGPSDTELTDDTPEDEGQASEGIDGKKATGALPLPNDNESSKAKPQSSGPACSSSVMVSASLAIFVAAFTFVL
jgi:hypothetical protein